MAIDGKGDVIIAGVTDASDLPGTMGGAQESFAGALDGFAASLAPDLRTLNQATYLGGGSGDGVGAVAIDQSGDVIVAGSTYSVDLPGTAGGAQESFAGALDGFAASLAPDLGTLEKASYLGGGGDDEATGVAIDGSGNVIVAGFTRSSDFPGTTGGAQADHASDFGFEDGFVASLAPDLATLNQATYLGGANRDYANAMAIDGHGNVLVAGETYSTDFPGTAGGAQATSTGGDAFVARLAPDLRQGLPVIQVPALTPASLLALSLFLGLVGALLVQRAWT